MLAILKQRKRGRSCIHLQYPTGFLIHAHAAGPCYIYICTFIYTYAHPAGPVYKCICNWPSITRAQHKAPFKRTRLLAQFTLHTSTHIRRCCEYPYAAVPFSHAHTSLFTHAQTVLFIHAHFTYANPNVALQSVDICWERADLLAFRLCCVFFMPSWLFVFLSRVISWEVFWNSIVSVPDHCLFIYCIITLAAVKAIVPTWTVKGSVTFLGNAENSNCQ